MASDKGPVATEAPFATPATQATAAAAISAAELFASPDSSRSGSLKRPRESTPTSPAVAQDPELSPSKIQRLDYASRHSPAPLTVALADELRREDDARTVGAVSDNPSHRALDALRSATIAMSRTQDAPDAAVAPTESDAPVKIDHRDASPSPHAQNPDLPAAGSPQPPSAASNPSLESSATQVVDSPAPMDVDQRNDQPGSFVAQPDAQSQDKNTAYSYPGIMPPNIPLAAPTAPQRGMSLPMSSSQLPEMAPRSPTSGNKKHKCPFCDTEFTRHHNLKSHLLTHSQEKPYMCQTCQMRFRRLHDLKRHSKLHTGEKPHICPNCDRKFARGDALARHAKGVGGCANRRQSMGSFGGGEDFDESAMHEGDDTAMSGVLYDGTEAMSEEDRRRLGLSGSKTSHAAVVPGPDGFGARPFAPPVAARQGPSAGLYSPATSHIAPDYRDSAAIAASAASSAYPITPSSAGSPYSSLDPGIPVTNEYTNTEGSFVPIQGITESPKALSPSSALAQLGHEPAPPSQRSPILTAQVAQQAYNRRQTDSAPQSMSRPFDGPLRPEPAQKDSHSNGDIPEAGASTQIASHRGDTHSRASSHGQNGGSGDSLANVYSSGDHNTVWAYIQSIDSKWEAILKNTQERLALVEAGKAAADTQILFLESKSTQLESRTAELGEEVQGLNQQVAYLKEELATLRGVPAGQQQQPQPAAELEAVA